MRALQIFLGFALLLGYPILIVVRNEVRYRALRRAGASDRYAWSLVRYRAQVRR